ncbi:MAG: hypothetical protein JO148_02515 [Acidimicrobiia bacterium]|nr:hypothetical protein [Acidimicrobiia bacterium]
MAVLTDEPVFVSDMPEPSPPAASASTLGAQLRWLIAGCSVGAAVIHIGYAPAHFTQYWLYGLFFVGVAWLQLISAAALVLRPSRPVLAGTAILNTAVVGVWLLSRTHGVWIGPNATIKEAARFPDILCSVLEVLIVYGCVVLLSGLGRTRGVATRVAFVGIGCALLLVGATSAYALTPRYTAAHVHTGASHDHAASAPVSGSTPCEKSGPPPSEGEVLDSQGHFHRGPEQQSPIDEATRSQLETQQTLARAVVQKYPTVADAERAGYVESTVYVPCIGAHYTNIALSRGFDPSTPSELLYDGTQPTSRIVGLSYLVYNPGGPPQGFAGPNDLWHQHNFNGGLCFNAYGQVIGSESVSQAQCAGLGGKKVELIDTWMLHDWVVPGFECSWGVFAPECPELGGRTGGTAWDAPAPAGSSQQQLGS